MAIPRFVAGEVVPKELAVSIGELLAQRFFLFSPAKVEAHLGKAELAAICAIAAEMADDAVNKAWEKAIAKTRPVRVPAKKGGRK